MSIAEENRIKGPVSRFGLQLFFMNHLRPAPYPLSCKEFFAKIREDIRNWREATAPVSTTQKSHIFPEMYTNSGDTGGKPATDVQDSSGILPPVSIIAGGKFSTGAINTDGHQ
jgi:hypothetical protein